MLQDRDVVDHVPHQRIGRLTAVMVRGYTELRMRVDEDMSCVVVEMDGTPCPVAGDKTAAGTDD
jgi:cyanophycinase-like exopeptidase